LRLNENRKLFALGAPGNRLRFEQRAVEIVRHEPAQPDDSDPIIVAVVEQMRRQVACARSLRAFQDHSENRFAVEARVKLCDADCFGRASSPSFMSNACMSSWRITRTSLHSCEI
jgi:hypothetical protein